jgi:hypothetical protein
MEVIIMSNNISSNLSRDLFVLDDENNPDTSQKNMIYPKTILDQVFDDQSPTKKNLRELLADLKQEIITGGLGNIIFPVTSVNGDTADVTITPAKLGLGRVDNTRDIDKPLSTPQRSAVMDIINGHDFKVNLDPLYKHLADNNNPHFVSIDQLDADNRVTAFVGKLISTHSLSDDITTHLDIRRSLAKLWSYVDESINGGLEARISKVLDTMNAHSDDPSAHYDLFKAKEDIGNKSVAFTFTNGDHTKYPSTRAVVEFVTEALKAFKKSFPDIKDWIVDIKSIPDRSELPVANEVTMGKCYVIRNGIASQQEIAICRKNPDGTFVWDISNTGAFSKFNAAHFEDTGDGMSIKLSAVIDALLTKTGDVDSTVSNVLRNYYTKDETNNQFIREINIIPGTMDGHIRYYINNDTNTMSSDIQIPGLKCLAYMEQVTEDEIRELAVWNRHMLSRSVDSRVLALKSVKQEHLSDVLFTADMLKTPKGTLLGNIMNTDGTVHSVNLTQLGDLLRPIIGGWPDISIPGVDAPLMEISPIMWDFNKEYPFVDGSVGQRFKGTISVLPNREIVTSLSTLITSEKYQILDAGGWWRTDSEAKIDALLGGGNITGNIFAEIVMSKYQLQLSTISIGNRVDAPFDVWVRYFPIPTFGK